jgi:hypothetical protein
MRYCDLVVRGTVESVTEEIKPESEAVPMLPGTRDDLYVRVKKVRLHVQEVLRGNTAKESLEFVAFVGMSVFKDNYVEGQETVVGLIWGDKVLGGSYWLNSENARFVQGEKGWVAQEGANVSPGLEEIRRQLRAASPEVAIENADLLVTGDVRDVRVETVRGDGTKTAVLMSIDVTNVRSVSGDALPTEIVVRQIMSGDYWPAWRDPAPFREQPANGKRYCFFLKKIDSGYALERGINGIFEVRNERLYFAGRTATNLTVQRVREIRQKQ